MKAGIFFYFVLALAMLSGMPSSSTAQTSANYGGGSVIIGQSVTACTSSIAGAVRWNISGVHEICNGTAWTSFFSQTTVSAATQPPWLGYFVLSNGLWDGNLGGREGADALCLTDLTNNDWMGKSNAVTKGQLTAKKVRSFLCSSTGSTGCNNLIPNVSYSFAVSGHPELGGASFMTDSSRTGPGNSESWAGTNYFGMDARYWLNRDSLSATNWDTVGALASVGVTCSGFTSNISTSTAKLGFANSASSARWTGNDYSCNKLNHIICMVHP